MHKNAVKALTTGLALGILMHFVDAHLRWLGLPPENNLIDETLIGGSVALVFVLLGLSKDLRRSEERLRLAAEAAKTGFWDWDITKDKQVWSDLCKALLGLPPDSPANFQVLMNSVHPDDRRRVWNEIQNSLKEKRDYACEFRVVWPDSSVHWRLGRGSAFYDHTGRATRMSGISVDIDKRKGAEERLHLQSEALQAVANSIVVVEPKGTILWTNRAFSELTGYTAEQVRGKRLSLLSSGKHDNAFYANLWQTITSGKTWHGEIINRRKDGSLYTEEQIITSVRSDSGEITHFVAVKQNVTERKHTEQQLLEREDRLRLILESTAEAIYGIDLLGRCTFCNPACLRLLGYGQADELLGKNMHDLIHHSRRGGTKLPVEECRIFRAFKSGQGIHVDDEVLWKADGTSFPVEYWSYPQRKGEDIVGAVVTFIDTSERKIAEARIQSLAYYDVLTGLPNRMLLHDRIAQALAGAQRRNEKVALLFLDLDRFKLINDSLGHTVGDLLLKDVAGRLTTLTRGQDTAARLGGDEFIIVLTELKDVTSATVAAERIVSAMKKEFVIQGHSLGVTCSLGISIFPDHGEDSEILIKNADAAMYCAKETGRNRFQFFLPEMNLQVVERLSLENRLREALQQEKELFLVYQPQADITLKTITGVEALVRWQHPELGIVSPEKFIPVAENSGLIVPLGEWVLRTACVQARAWQDQGLPAVPIAVNVSAIQFRQQGFLDLVRTVLHDTGLAPQYLELELTESLILSTADVVLSVLMELKEMGVKLSIDDFGTGYSSLSYLRRLPVSKLKIDRSFVQDIALDADHNAITGTIISMAKNLNLKVIAEGVETEEQMSFLRANHCDEIQGYHFSKPLLAEELINKLRGNLLLAPTANCGLRHQTDHADMVTNWLKN